MRYLKAAAVLTVVIALALGSAGSAFAKGPPDENPGKGPQEQVQGQEKGQGQGQGQGQGKKRGFFGDVTAANDGNITLVTKQGWTVTVSLTDATKYKIHAVTRGWVGIDEFVDALEGNITALEGSRVAVSASGVIEDPEGEFGGEAKKLSVVPARGKREPMHAHRTGVVTALDLSGSGTIAIVDVKDVTHEFVLSGNDTVYRPEGTQAGDIVVGESFVTVVTTGDPKLGPAAKAIVLHDKKAGEQPTPTTEVFFSSATYSIEEGNVTATITVELSPGSSDTVTVQYATGNGTAMEPGDYSAASGTLTFAPGVTSHTFGVSIVDDAIDEGDETVNLALSSPGNASLGSPDTATLTISDNDVTEVFFSSATYSIEEGNVTATITVELSLESTQTVMVQYATGNGTATEPDDYLVASGTLTFDPGDTVQTFGVAIVDDEAVEVDETVDLTLSSPTNALLGSLYEATLTISDDESA